MGRDILFLLAIIAVPDFMLSCQIADAKLLGIESETAFLLDFTIEIL